MRLTFNIEYHALAGESLYISGGIDELYGSRQMHPAGDGLWALNVEFREHPGDFRYRFSLRANGNVLREEWGVPHLFSDNKDVEDVDIFALWQDRPDDLPYYSSAFRDGILRRQYIDQPLKAKPATLCLRVEAPMVAPDEVLAISGEGDALGNWQPQQAIRMNDSRFPIWEANVPLDAQPAAFQYKFVALDRKTLMPRRWENCDNRSFAIARRTPETRIVVDGLRFANNFVWRGTGTAIPVFSLRSEKDFGIGDFMDIKRAVDWLERTGQKVLQLLPVNDTTLYHTRGDSYPYRANSTFALHPLYVRLEKTGSLSSEKRREHYENLRRELNSLPEVDYERVAEIKFAYLREIYAERGEKTAATPEFQEFVEKNDYWLKPYAVWCALRDRYGTPDCRRWLDMAVYGAAKTEKYRQEHRRETGLYYFIQYHLDKQLREARDYAHAHGVVLKGDIPIGISHDSVDAWQMPELFNMNTQAGAPPDAFSVMGQNWGFPTYNWERMAEDGYEWWKNRFRKMAEYFDAYRIDHILGFFRIWEIPMDKEHGLSGYFNPALPLTPEEMLNRFGFRFHAESMTRPLFNADDVLFIEDPYQKGKYHPRISIKDTTVYKWLDDDQRHRLDTLYEDFFYHRHNEFWHQQAMRKLPALTEATQMLTCAEDLGMIPACVPDVMDTLQILSLEIQRMPKTYGVEFADPAEYPYKSVCTTSTHDMTGIRGWWEEEERGKIQRYYNNVLHHSGDAPATAEPWICTEIVRQHLKSNSMLCILPLQDWLSTDGALRLDNPHDERINDPADSHNYWNYRMHMTLERLLNENDFNTRLRESITH